MSQLINRITFEKGKVNFLKQLAKKLHDYEHTLSSKIYLENSKVEIADHLKALRFGTNKFALVILNGMVQWMNLDRDQQYYACRNDSNPLGIPNDDWQVFLE
jgi:hypothetical protein